MRSTLTRILVGAAIAATAVGGAVGAAGAAGATTKTHTTLSIVESGPRSPPGSRTTSAERSGRTMSPTDKKTIELKRWNVHAEEVGASAGQPDRQERLCPVHRLALLHQQVRVRLPRHQGAGLQPQRSRDRPRQAGAFQDRHVAEHRGEPEHHPGRKHHRHQRLPDHHHRQQAAAEGLVYLYRWNANTSTGSRSRCNVTGPKGGVSFTRKPPVGTVTFELQSSSARTKLAPSTSDPVTVTVNS